MSQMIMKAYAERVPTGEETTEDGKCWYILHHVVYHPKKTEENSPRFRLLLLLQGQDRTDKLIGVVTKFGQENVAFTTNI